MSMIIAHRGSKGTHPENTLAAFREAVRVGAEGIELDVQLTKDKHLVVIHDETIERTTDGQGAVQDFTLSQIQTFDAGSWFDPMMKGQRIPTLKEVLLLLKKEGFKGLLNIEIKTDKIRYHGIEQILVKEMNQEEWAFDFIYSSFYFPSLEKVREIDKNANLAFVFKVSDSQVQSVFLANDIDGFHPKMDWLLTYKEMIPALNKPVRPWTVNDETQMRICFQLGVAGFHTDFPEKALRLRNLITNKRIDK